MAKSITPRTAIACTNCRKRKIKCTRGEPGQPCITCVGRNLKETCNYSSSLSERPQSSQKKQTLTLNLRAPASSTSSGRSPSNEPPMVRAPSSPIIHIGDSALRTTITTETDTGSIPASAPVRTNEANNNGRTISRLQFLKDTPPASSSVNDAIRRHVNTSTTAPSSSDNTGAAARHNGHSASSSDARPRPNISASTPTNTNTSIPGSRHVQIPSPALGNIPSNGAAGSSAVPNSDLHSESIDSDDDQEPEISTVSKTGNNNGQQQNTQPQPQPHRHQTQQQQQQQQTQSESDQAHRREIRMQELQKYQKRQRQRQQSLEKSRQFNHSLHPHTNNESSDEEGSVANSTSNIFSRSPRPRVSDSSVAELLESQNTFLRQRLSAAASTNEALRNELVMFRKLYNMDYSDLE